MSNQGYLFHSLPSVSSNPFTSFNFQLPSQTQMSAPSLSSSPQPSMDSHSHLHPSLSASPTHSQVHDYSDSLSVSHSAIPFPSVHQITANEFGGDTLEVEDTNHNNVQNSHTPNPFNAFNPFTNSTQTSSGNSFASMFGSNSNSLFNNLQTSSVSSSTPFTFSQQAGTASSSPFTQNSSFNLSQLTNNNKLFTSQSGVSTNQASTIPSSSIPSSPSPSSSPKSPTPESSSVSSSSKDGSGFYTIRISADVLARRPALAEALENRRRPMKRPLDCLDSPALLRAVQQAKMARTQEIASGKSALSNDEEKGQMQEESKKQAQITFSPSVVSSLASNSVSSASAPAINRRRQRTEEMDTTSPTNSSSSARINSNTSLVVKRCRNNDEGPILKNAREERRRTRDPDEQNPFPARDYSKTESNFMEIPRGKKTNTSGEPVYTLAQVKKIVLEALKNQENELREEYDVVLHELLSEQFESFSNFNQAYVSRQMAAKTDSTYFS